MIKTKIGVRRTAAAFLMLSAMLLAGIACPARAETGLQVDVLGLTTDAISTGGFGQFTLKTQTDGFLYLMLHYLRINFPSQNKTSWGVQLYTDNAPHHTWVPVDPNVYGGLRGVGNPTIGVPLRWQVYDQLQNVAPTWGTAQSVTMTVGGLAFYDDNFLGHTLSYWGVVKDKSDADMADWNAVATIRKRTVVDHQYLGNFPSASRPYHTAPVYVYLGLDLRPVPANDQFFTSLRVDLYNLGLDLSTGGFATPNPFTPRTGQRTNFNFFLSNITAGFTIRIFTLRGRCIRTITDTKEWDGRNDNGQWVEGGLYIYQIEAEGKRVSGTVVLIN